ncbi:hypothetical protein EJ06DRAFT_141870 [Trichodelitschia bisporula]|uniref:Uncharacterized protein n=1 Tax=Trichodelitschia bisporula TaxID=703511 RepID=A0A6G1HPR7_9PEZI|nr:hypothetical protein EJ06DRAFT_141870 [Trichodelitschia bisporula]
MGMDEGWPGSLWGYIGAFLSRWWSLFVLTGCGSGFLDGIGVQRRRRAVEPGMDGTEGVGVTTDANTILQAFSSLRGWGIGRYLVLCVWAAGAGTGIEAGFHRGVWRFFPCRI